MCSFLNVKKKHYTLILISKWKCKKEINFVNTDAQLSNRLYKYSDATSQ
jgi:hypothetical protein